MMKSFFLPLIIAASVVSGAFVYFMSMRPPHEISRAGLVRAEQTLSPESSPSGKTLEERVVEAKERSSNIKGLYMTADVANDAGAGATRLRDNLIRIADETEINGMVIDVKEVCGPDYDESRLKGLLDELRKKNIWTIGRIATFKDASQIDVHPEWYLKRTAPKVSARDECYNKRYLREKRADGQKSVEAFWRDDRGGYWFDPASPGARAYIADLSKKMIDLGFDEIQFDYIRFPSDGDVVKAIYPAWDGKTPKFEVMKSFFAFLNSELKSYKPEIILSADLFGYAALRGGDVGIGQRLDDVGDSFDYASFMVYPSHYYSGLFLPADSLHDLPAINFNVHAARMNPGVTVGRSLQVARDFLDGRIGTSTLYAAPGGATSSVPSLPKSNLRLRPWLEDFYHEADATAGRPSGAQKVRLQIDGAEEVESHGWLLWSAANVYSEGALKKE